MEFHYDSKIKRPYPTLIIIEEKNNPMIEFDPLTIEGIVQSLSLKEATTILHCEQEGNGKYYYYIHALVKKGLMSLKPIPKLQMIEAYRLNDLGLAVRQFLSVINQPQ